MSNSQKVTEELGDLGLQANERAFREGRGSLKREVFALIDDNESPDLIWLRKQIQEL